MNQHDAPSPPQNSRLPRTPSPLFAVSEVQIRGVVRERNALVREVELLRNQRDQLLAAAERVFHANNLTEAKIAVLALNSVAFEIKSGAVW